MTEALNNWFTRWWDFVDDRGIFRRAIVVVSVWMLWDVSKWGMVYADKALEKGIVDASIGAVIAAVGGPATFLVGWVAKIYMDSRKDRA